MLTFTMVLMGMAMVVGSIALVGLCVLPAPPPTRVGYPPRARARRRV
jgi:hypothetical protein